MTRELKLLRVYDLGGDVQGYRVLVDRLWPRGLRKEALRLDRWAKEVAPSSELRRWFAHAEERFDAFAAAYRSELEGNPNAEAFTKEMAALLEKEDVLLLYAAKSPACNHAVVLRDWMLEQFGRRRE